MTVFLPEVLAPVATFAMCEAAVAGGADAIYIGLPGFNARGRTPVIETNVFEQIIIHCHEHNTKVFIAVNVLIFESELAQVLDAAIKVAALGVDAFIVQDIGLVRLLRLSLPEIPIHASTQMSISSGEAILATESLEIARYVLSRELSLREIEKIRATTHKELEVFVHGALCVSYSGQCLTSERVGGRSANRGQCAQSCRWPYTLIVDGIEKSLPNQRYLVSPKDLVGINEIQHLKNIGVNSLKIEGRLKSPAYVAATTQSYRAAVDSTHPPPSESVQDLALLFSRGQSAGWFNGVNHQTMVDGRFGSHHGRELGTVTFIDKDTLTITGNFNKNDATALHPQPGDGIAICNFITDERCGAQVYKIKYLSPTSITLTIKPALGIWAGNNKDKTLLKVFVNSRPSLESFWNRLSKDNQRRHRIPVTLTVEGEIGQPLLLTIKTEELSITAESAVVLEPSVKSPLTLEFVKKELSSLTATPLKSVSFEYKIKGNVFIHHREMKHLRRQAVQFFLTQLQERPLIKTTERLERVLSAIKSNTSSLSSAASSLPQANLHVMIRSLDQLAALKGMKLGMVYLDFEFDRDFKEGVALSRSLGHKVGLVTTRIFKPGEGGHIKLIERLKPDGVLVRNLAALELLKKSTLPLIGDFSLNITNSFTFNWLRSQGFERLTASYDLNEQELTSLASKEGMRGMEVTVHHHMPSFHMEHCVFAALLSKGTSYKDCGRPCEKHKVQLQDPSGYQHVLKPDSECRNTMYYAIPQSAGSLIPSLHALGVRDFRIEALYDTVTELQIKTEAYLSIIHDNANPKKILDSIGAIETCGVNEGQLLKINTHKTSQKVALASF
jgi:U32 family peptidase